MQLEENKWIFQSKFKKTGIQRCMIFSETVRVLNRKEEQFVTVMYSTTNTGIDSSHLDKKEKKNPADMGSMNWNFPD